MLYLDFETRSEVDLAKVGSAKYAEDTTTTVLCMAYGLHSGPVALWVPGEKIPTTVIGAISANIPVEAHNALFERLIWRNIMVREFGWPEMPEGLWRCSAARAAAHSLPRSLAKAIEVLGLSTQKDDTGRRIMLKMCKPRRPSKHNPARWHETPEQFKVLDAYCIKDVEAERCLSKALRPLSQQEQKVWELDQIINARGVRIDMPAVRAAIDLLEEEKANLDKQCVELTAGVVSSGTQVIKLKNWCQARTSVPIDSLDKAAVVEHLKNPDIAPLIKQALRLRQRASKTSTAKYFTLLASVCSDGRLRDLYLYWAAITGRWAGKLVQPQNFPRNEFKGDLMEFYRLLSGGDREEFRRRYPDVMATLSQCIRGVFIPSEGDTFFGGDFAGVELRMAFWLADDQNALRDIADGKDPYVELAKYIYQTDDISEEQRGLGKRGMLSGIYGTGWEKFQATCLGAGVEVSEEMAKNTIGAFRHKHSRVVEYWKTQLKAAVTAIEEKKAITVGHVTWGVIDDFLHCRLPSGRRLTYCFPEIERGSGYFKDSFTYMSVNSVNKQWQRTWTHGGKVTENIDSGICRDILAEKALASEAAGYQVALMTHDELVTERTMGSVEAFHKILTETPTWCRTFPLGAKCWEGQRYLK